MPMSICLMVMAGLHPSSSSKMLLLGGGVQCQGEQVRRGHDQLVVTASMLSRCFLPYCSHRELVRGDTGQDNKSGVTREKDRTK